MLSIVFLRNNAYMSYILSAIFHEYIMLTIEILNKGNKYYINEIILFFCLAH